ncbi:MAG: hypothetical protein JST04_06880 [Bdellovibrionales bacterium]|nr:hypothetical protein [Bdellovibrionales bacterium]
MNKRARFGFLALVSLLSATAFGAEPGSADSIERLFVRAKGGLSMYSKLDPVTSAFGVGLDIGYLHRCGFGLTGMAKLNFSSSDSTTSGGANTSADVKSHFLGLAPTYSVTRGNAYLSFGIGVGSFGYSGQTTTVVSNVATYGESSESRFALAPTFQVDIGLGSTLFLNLGATYIVTLGKSPHFADFSPMAGLGLNF